MKSKCDRCSLPGEDKFFDCTECWEKYRSSPVLPDGGTMDPLDVNGPTDTKLVRVWCLLGGKSHET